MKFLSGLLIGSGINWIVICLVANRIIHRDILFNQLLEENKAYKKVVDKWKLQEDEKNKDEWDWGKSNG